MPDYTNQLNEIVRLLNRPGVSPWLLSAFSVFLGIIGGAIGRALEPCIIDFSRRRKMRRVVYQDIAKMFEHVSTITSFGEPWADDERRNDAFRRLSGSFSFKTETYFISNPDVFMQLDEHQSAQIIYARLHRIIDEGPEKMNNNCSWALGTLGRLVRNGSLQEKHFRKYAPDQADGLMRRATTEYDQVHERNTASQNQSDEIFNGSRTNRSEE